MKAPLSGCASVLALAFGSPLSAQEAPRADSAVDHGENVIIVTATKREQSVQDVPISINVIDGDLLADSGINNMQDLVGEIPGLVYIESPTIPVLQLRGFASPANNPASDQTVAVYQDGIFSGRARQFQRPFFDVQRMEILRGPQGALLGKNTAAGALNIVSKDPTDSFEAGITATYLFDRDGIDTTGYVSGPLSDTLSARAAVNYTTWDKGWMYNLAYDEWDPRRDIISGRLSFDFHPSDNFTMVTKAEFSDLEYVGTGAANFDGTQPLKDIIEYVRDNDNFGMQDGLDMQSWQIGNTATVELDPFTLVIVSGYAGFEASSVGGGGANNPEVFATTLIEEFEQFSQEFRLLSPTGGTLEWVAGLYGDIATYKSENLPRYFLFGGLFDGQGHTYYDESGMTLSAYATGTIHLSEQLRATLGVRGTYTEKNANFLVDQDFGRPFFYTPGLYRYDKVSDTFLDPSLTVQYDVVSDVMVYGSYQRGSKGATFQSTNRTVAADVFALEPERSESFEIGVKSQVGDWLTLNLAAFHVTFSNLQSSQYVGTPPSLTVVNVGKSRSKGIEYDVQLRPVTGFSLTASGAYIDAYYVDYEGAPCTFEQLANGCVNGSINAAGRPLSGVPEFSGTVAANLDMPLGDSLDLTARLSANHETRSNVDANVQNPLYGFKPANVVVNGRIGIGHADRWEVALVATNLFNEKTWNSAIAWGPPFVGAQTVNARVNPSRSIGLQVKLEM